MSTETGDFLGSIKPGDKLTVQLRKPRECMWYRKGSKLDMNEKSKKVLSASSHTFECIENPAGGAGDFWVVTEYPTDSGTMIGMALGFLRMQVSKADSGITVSPFVEETVTIKLLRSMIFCSWEKDSPPGRDAELVQESIGPGVYQFKTIPHPVDPKNGGKFLVTEYPENSGKMYGLAEKWLHDLADKGDEGVIIEEGKGDRVTA